MTSEPCRDSRESMADFQFDAEKHIVIASKVYDRESLPEQVRTVITHINHADQELATQEHNTRVFRMGRDQIVKELIGKIDELELTPIAVMPDQAEPAPEGTAAKAK